MTNTAKTQFNFIADALTGSGGFAPQTAARMVCDSVAVTSTYLVQYPRETAQKFNRRNAIAVYRNFLLSACTRFTGYLFGQAIRRETESALFKAMLDDIDRKGNSADMFWLEFSLQAKARGSMLLLIDMPEVLPGTLADQIKNRALPYFTMIKPEEVADYALDDTGRFDWVALPMMFEDKPAWKVFDKTGWHIQEPKENGAVFVTGEHPLSECPVLIFTESGDFPCIGEFAQIAELSKAWFNRVSERDEQLRGQTFNLFTYQLGEGETRESVGETLTVGTSNALLYKGERPGFIAPDASCLESYATVIAELEAAMRDIGYHIELTNQAEAAAALALRFKNLSSALSLFAQRLNDFEKRCWYLAAQWLGGNDMPEIVWPARYDLADIANELTTLQQMQLSGFAPAVIAEQQKRVIQIQFQGIEQSVIDAMLLSADEQMQEVINEQ